MSTDIIITSLKPEHYEEVKAIYTQGIIGGNSTFETEPPTWSDWDKKHLFHSRVIALLNNKVVGWAALSGVSDRCAYSGVTENSVYVDKHYQGNGIGLALLKKLIEESETNGIWTIEARIFPENKASISLHQKCGFRILGEYHNRGKMGNTWRNVVLMERRSNKVGID